MAWISGNYYLSQSEMENNALEFRAAVFSRLPSATLNGVAAILGNMQTESTINPGIWENLSPFDVNYGGYGLVQWTPWTKYSDWAGSGWENNGSKQVERIVQYEAIDYPGTQWFSNGDAPLIGLPVDPPITLLQLLESNQSPALLAKYFLCYYEHPGSVVASHQARSAQALAWYEFLSGHPYHDKIKKWLLIRRPLDDMGHYRRYTRRLRTE